VQRRERTESRQEKSGAGKKESAENVRETPPEIYENLWQSRQNLPAEK